MVKICGICRAEHAVASVKAGADFIGLVFYPGSRRFVTVAQARDIVGAVISDNVAVVGLFVNQALEEVAGAARSCRMDCVQLCGNEPPEMCLSVTKETGLPVIKAIRPRVGESPGDLAAEAADYPESAAPLLLVDGPSLAAWGGTGQPWDYSGAREVAKARRVFLAGGLNAKNVADAISQARPWGVDVSSGVESSGAKDPAKILEFVDIVRRQERSGEK